MRHSWDERVDAFWSEADDSRPDDMFRTLQTLLDEREPTDPDALYEWASLHDFLGRESDAVPLYESALQHGLDSPRRQQAVVQLASSLRNIGRPSDAVDLLEGLEPDEVIGNAGRAFLALALHDCGRHTDALRVALLALAPTLPRYGRAVTAYAEDLAGTPGTPDH